MAYSWSRDFLSMCIQVFLYEQLHEKTCFLHMQKQRCRSASLFFPYIASTISHLSKSEISSLYPSSVAVQPLFMSELFGNPEDRFSRDVALYYTQNYSNN